MASSREDQFYLMVGLTGIAITAIYFILLGLPLNFETLQDVALLTLYTMVWLFWLLALASFLTVIIIPRVTGKPEDSVRKGVLFRLTTSHTTALFASLAVLFLSESVMIALLSFLFLWEALRWVGMKAGWSGKPKRQSEG